MNPARVLYATWIGGAFALIAVAVTVGVRTSGHPFGSLRDGRGRYSLTHVHVAMWTVAVLPLFAAVAAARLAAHVPNPLDFSIPGELLAVLGVTAGSAVSAVAVKSMKERRVPQALAANDTTLAPRLSQILLVEEGRSADHEIDLTKLQSLFTSLFLIASYVGAVVNAIGDDVALHDFTLPTLSGTLVALLGVSQAGYLAAKIPGRDGIPLGPTVMSLDNPAAVHQDPLMAAASRQLRYATASTSQTRSPRRPMEE
jgi:hypothetical protein